MLAFFSFLFLIYIFITDNISISVYITCVILCLFSALSRSGGALQISIFIIIIYIIEGFIINTKHTLRLTDVTKTTETLPHDGIQRPTPPHTDDASSTAGNQPAVSNAT